MPQTRNAWILWTVVGCAILVSFGWFLGVSPMLEERATILTETEELASSNDILDVEVSSLRSQFAELDLRKAELAGLQVPLPTDLEMSSLVSEIDTVATGAGVVLTEVGASSAIAVIPPVGPAPAPEPTPASTDATSSEVAAPVSTPVTNAVDPLVTIPLSLTAFGSYEEITAFLRDLQNTTSRYVLVSSMQVDAPTPAPESAGAPEIAAGDLKVVIVAYGFAYADLSDQLLRLLEPAEVLPLPGRPDGRSQFQPVETPDMPR